MTRKRAEYRTAPLREDRLDLLDIRRQCHRWANDHLDALRIADPQALTPTFETVTANWT